MISIKRTFLTLCLALIAIAGFAQNETAWKALEKPLNFYLVNDLGRNGYYDQKPIAELLGKMADIMSTYTGRRALHDMNGVIIMVRIRSFRLSSVRVAIMAGTLQPNPITNGINDFPCNPILCISLSIMNEARAI